MQKKAIRGENCSDAGRNIHSPRSFAAFSTASPMWMEISDRNSSSFRVRARLRLSSCRTPTMEPFPLRAGMQ